MKRNLAPDTLPELTLPRLSSILENLADSFSRFALEFGLNYNDSFGPRLAAIGFANAVILTVQEPLNADRLEVLLAAESVPPNEELEDVAQAFVTSYKEEKDWSHEVGLFLQKEWRISADNVPDIAYGLETQLRILHALRIGIIVARQSPETATSLMEHHKELMAEHRFLCDLLYYWSDNDWEPYAPPYIEFTNNYYKPGSAEQRIIRGFVAVIYPVAIAMDEPWKLSFWVEMGWSGGRNLARSHPKDLQLLLTETAKSELQSCQWIYQTYVVGSAATNGEINIERAALRFIGGQKDPSLARSYCTGSEPRRLARAIYDFAFWMGIFASQPVPIVEEEKANGA